MLISLLASFLLASCDRKERMAKMAEENIFQTVEHSEGLRITAVSEPDSSFGISYLSQKEVNAMTTLMGQVTDVIMKRTGNMTEFNPDDRYVMDLAERQMRAMAELRSMIGKNNEKGEFSGWRSDGSSLTRREETSSNLLSYPCHKLSLSHNNIIIEFET